MGLSQALKKAAVSRMARGNDPVVRSASSHVDSVTRWKDVQGLIARAVVADPDVVFYFRGLPIMQGLAALSAAKVAAEDALIALAGARLPQRELDTARLARLAKSGRDVEALVKQGVDPASLTWLSDAQWAGAFKEMGAALQSGSQVGPRGAEAKAKFDSALGELSAAWSKFGRYYRAMLNPSLGSESRIRAVAAQSALGKTLKTLEMSIPATRQTEFINQLAAGFSATKAMSQEFSFSRRLVIENETVTLPTGFAATAVMDSGSLVGFTRTESQTGNSVSGSLLNIAVGDRVFVNSSFFLGEREVTAITSTGFSFGAVSLGEQQLHKVEVIPLSSLYYEPIVEQLIGGFVLGPSAASRRADYLQEFTARLSQIRGIPESPAEDILLSKTLYDFILSVDEPSVAATRAFTRLSVGLPGTQYAIKMSTLLALGNPAFILSQASIPAFRRGRAILRMLKSEGWLRAYDEVRATGSLDTVFLMEDKDATYSTSVEELVSGIRGSSEMWNAGVR